MATAEAMARGCVPIVTPTGFGAEVIDGLEAFVVPFGDMNAMEKHVRRLVRDDALFGEMSKRARHRVEDFRWSLMCQQLADRYESWLNSQTAM